MNDFSSLVLQADYLEFVVRRGRKYLEVGVEIDDEDYLIEVLGSEPDTPDEMAAAALEEIASGCPGADKHGEVRIDLTH